MKIRTTTPPFQPGRRISRGRLPNSPIYASRISTLVHRHAMEWGLLNFFFLLLCSLSTLTQCWLPYLPRISKILCSCKYFISHDAGTCVSRSRQYAHFGCSPWMESNLRCQARTCLSFLFLAPIMGPPHARNSEFSASDAQIQKAGDLPLSSAGGLFWETC